MRPKLELLEQELVERIVGEAYELLWDPGVLVHREGALKLLADGGATVDFEKKTAGWSHCSSDHRRRGGATRC
jgi:trimethylamine:corrinoid methyltransferase-like protein